MTTAATSLLGLALPVTGELSGVWGQTVNDSITTLLDSAVAGTTTLSTDADVTLTTTTLAANQARQAILLCSGARTALRTITAPAQSKIYTVINSTTGGYAVKIVGVGPTTGVTIGSGQSAQVAWNGSDFVQVGASAGGSNTQVQYNNNGALAGSANLTFNGTTLTANALTVTNATTLSGGTANGVAYLNGSKVVTTGSALTFDGTNLGVGVTPSAWSSFTGLQVGPSGSVSNSGTGTPVSAFSNNAYYNGTSWVYINTAAAAQYQLSTSQHIWRYAASGSGNITWSEAMRLDTSGNLGIGTSSPSQLLQARKDQAAYTWMRVDNQTNSASAYAGLAIGANGNTWGITVGSSAANSNALNFVLDATGTNASKMTLDTSGNLGIGTSSPSTKLHIAGNTFRHNDATGSYGYTISAATNTTTLATLFGGSSFAIQTGASGTNQFLLDASGNLGLGVTPSAWSGLTSFSIASTGSNISSASNDNLFITSGAYYNGTNWIYKATSQAVSQYNQLGGAHKWYYAASGTAGNAITFTQAMTLDASGNLGVGTTSPKANGGYATFTLNNATNGGVVQYCQNDTTIGQLFFDGNGGTLRTVSNTSMVFGTNNTERARFTSGGYFKASSTGTYNSSTGSYHELRGSAADTALYVQNTNASSPYGIEIDYTAIDPNGTGNAFLGCYGITTLRAQFRSNGGLANYSANNVNLSDRREKTNFAPAGEYLSKICAIPVQTFNYIDQNLEEDDGLTLGVVAQDVQAVAPELVTESNWGTAEEPKMRLSIYQTDLQYALMKCIQEQQALITQLTERITALESK